MAVKRTKLINTSRVMREIWIDRETTRVKIARNLGLDKSTISAIVTELLDLGVIKEISEGIASPQGGRKPVHISLNREFGCVVGIELRPESYTAVAVDLAGEVVFSKFERMAVAGTRLRDRVLAVIEGLKTELDHSHLPVLGVGVGLSGVIDHEQGIVRYSIPLKLEHPYYFYEDMDDQLGVPFFIENDANACAWGELAFHRRKDLRDFMFVLVELRELERTASLHEKTAVGFGIVIDGKVHYGYRNAAGEFRSIFRGPEHRGQFSLSEEESFRIEHDPQLMRRFLRELAKHVALFVNTFDLSHVFLGGTVDLDKYNIRELLFELIQQNWPYEDEVPVRIAFSSLRERAVAYGAAGMVLDRLFADLEVMEGVADLRTATSSLLPGWPLGQSESGIQASR